MSKKPRLSPVVFDDALFDADVQRASDAGAAAARAARKRFESEGVPRDELRKCEAEGPEGSQLPACLKVYLPPPAGRFGMVFQLEIVDGRAHLPFQPPSITPPRAALLPPAGGRGRDRSHPYKSLISELAA